MNEFDTPLDCPYCGAMLEGHSGPKETPEEGDVSICMYCARPLIVTEDVTLRKPTLEELKEIMAIPLVRRAISLTKKHGPRDPGRRRAEERS